MLIPPKYFLTPKISELLGSIQACKEVIDNVQIPPEVEINIRRQSILKSSLFSARIEGNNLTLDDLQNKSSKDLPAARLPARQGKASQKKIEVFNILKAINLILEKKERDISLNQILRFHEIVMDNLSENSGKFRSEVSAIFNTAGIAIYMPPPLSQIQPLMNELLSFINSGKERFVPIRACLSHFVFEKIHPFLDGNGRVGRLLLQAILHKEGYGMKGMLSLEEHLDSHRSFYYGGLENSEKDVTDYLEFMLEAISVTAQDAKNRVVRKKEFRASDFLLPRRAEILNIIIDHKLVNFDQIRRRFFAVNERTLRYDLKKLIDSGFIIKRGATKGVYYQAKE